MTETKGVAVFGSWSSWWDKVLWSKFWVGRSFLRMEKSTLVVNLRTHFPLKGKGKSARIITANGARIIAGIRHFYRGNGFFV